jgi:hypothetical protein
MSPCACLPLGVELKLEETETRICLPGGNGFRARDLADMRQMRYIYKMSFVCFIILGIIQANTRLNLGD